MIFLAVFSSCSNFNSDKFTIGSAAPEISLPDTNGKLVNLSTLRGKPVLVHFWASWCKPCREGSPALVAIYNKYKDGFTIYSISLDEKKSQWLNAIKKDHLDWDTHVNDINGMNSAAAEAYNVNYIPASFLIDKGGIILSKNLEPEELDKALNQIMK